MASSTMPITAEKKCPLVVVAGDRVSSRERSPAIEWIGYGQIDDGVGLMAMHAQEWRRWRLITHFCVL